MPDINELWDYLKEQFQKEMTPPSYDTWILSAKPLSLEHGDLTIQVPKQLYKDYWHKNLVSKVVQASYTLFGQDINPVIVTEDEMSAVTPATETGPTPTFKVQTHLNNKYTFENFVVGKGNQMAHAAALAVAEAPGTTYNPLFIYGGVGLGKTHLMQAIGNLVLQTNPAANIKYVTSENFTNDFINSLQTNQQEQFRQDYRNVDVLLVDDIQFFGPKEVTQEEFFNTFETLFNNKKQIVLTSDRLPNEIPKLQERLVSRFKMGLSVDVTPPDLETRIAILRNKAIAEDLSIPGDTLTYIAGQIDSNVRELEGALVRVQAYSTVKKADISTSLAADALKGLKLDRYNGQLTIAQVQDAVAKYYQVTVTDLKGKKRVKQIVMPRQIAMYLAREMTDSSLPKIGQEFGGKDHTTVIHAHEKIAAAMTHDEDLKNQIVELRNAIKNRG